MYHNWAQKVKRGTASDFSGEKVDLKVSLRAISEGEMSINRSQKSFKGHRF